MHWAADLVRAKDPYFMNLDVIHRTVTFEIDHSHPRYLRTVIYRMETCKLNVKSYAGETIPGLGQLHVNVTHENKQFSHLKMVVLRKEVVLTLGREWLNQIQWNWNN